MKFFLLIAEVDVAKDSTENKNGTYSTQVNQRSQEGKPVAYFDYPMFTKNPYKKGDRIVGVVKIEASDNKLTINLVKELATETDKVATPSSEEEIPF